MATSLWRRAGEVTVGRTTVPYVLRNAPCEVLVSRGPGAPVADPQRVRSREAVGGPGGPGSSAAVGGARA
jgi:hypothetical protein